MTTPVTVLERIEHLLEKHLEMIEAILQAQEQKKEEKRKLCPNCRQMV